MGLARIPSINKMRSSLSESRYVWLFLNIFKRGKRSAAALMGRKWASRSMGGLYTCNVVMGVQFPSVSTSLPIFVFSFASYLGSKIRVTGYFYGQVADTVIAGD